LVIVFSISLTPSRRKVLTQRVTHREGTAYPPNE
jgi:hypothetical protein